jgi:hypothetical protein
MPLPPVGATAPAASPASVSRHSSFSTALANAAAGVRSRQISPERHPLIGALDGVERAQRRLDAVLEAARAGRTFTAGELLGLQAQAYRYSQTVDLASKIVEQGVQSVKQAANTQV